jgi:hypothetical protein
MMPSYDEVKEAKTKTLRTLVETLKLDDVKKKIFAIEMLGNFVAFGTKVEYEKTAMDALEEAKSDKKRRVRKAAEKAIEKIINTKRESFNPLDMFDGGVVISSKK